MKESIFGKSTSVILRLVALAGFLFFVGIGTTYSQGNYVDGNTAVQLLRPEISQFKAQASPSPFAYGGPEAMLSVSPQLYANYFMADAVYTYLESHGTSVDLAAAIVGAKERGLELAKVQPLYFQTAELYLTELLTN